MRILTRNNLRQIIPIEPAIEAVASAFVQLSNRNATVPLRQHLAVGTPENLALIMPAHLNESAALGVKLLTLFPHNRGPKPMIQALITLFDANDGTPLALMDGTFLTALRTGAASGVATRAMAREDAQVLTLFGAGATALHQVLAVCAVRPIKRIWLVNRTVARAEQLAAELSTIGGSVPADIQTTQSARIALAEADVICTATASTNPLFDDSDVRPGTHINAIGAYLPTMQEIPAATVARAHVMVDQRAAAWAEAGDLVIPRDLGLIDETHIVGELGEAIAGTIAGRTSAEQLTLFKSVGNAAQDIAVAHLALLLAREQHSGIEVDLD